MNDIAQIQDGADTPAGKYGLILWAGVIILDGSLIFLEEIIGIEIDSIMKLVAVIATVVTGFYRIRQWKFTKDISKLEKKKLELEIENMQKNNNTIPGDNQEEG